MVMAYTTLFELLKISCEIYVNTFSNVYAISHTNAPPHAYFSVSVNEKYIRGKEFPLPTLGFCKVLVI